MKTHQPNDEFSISSLIRKVHEELIESQKMREDAEQDPLFEVESLTIEANFVVSTTTEGKGKVDLKIVGVDGMKNVKKEQIHKLTLKLKTTDLEQVVKLEKNSKRKSAKGRSGGGGAGSTSSSTLRKRVRPLPAPDKR